MGVSVRCELFVEVYADEAGLEGGLEGVCEKFEELGAVEVYCSV